MVGRGSAAFGEDFAFVGFDLVEVGGAGGGVLGGAVVVPDGAEGEGFGFFQEGEAGGVVAFVFGGAEFGGGFEEGDEEGFEHGAGADDPGGDAVDGGVEEVEADVDAGGEVVGDDFAGDVAEVVVEGDDVVGVPADAAGDVEEDFGEVDEDGGDFVGDGFGGVVVAGVEAEEFVVFEGVAEVELVGADGVGFEADAEEFSFDGVEVECRVDGFGEELVEGLFESEARGEAVGGGVFVAVGDPDVGDAG